MLTRRDLIHSRQFLQQRLTTALVAQKADPLDWSGRRMAGATFIGLMVAIIAFAGVGIYALLVPGGNTKWQACDAPIVEKETGATYICQPGQRLLYPMANFASARLFTLDNRPVYHISAASLSYPRGPLLGIAGAPDTLPAANKLLTGAWTICHRSNANGTPTTTLFAGSSSIHGTDLGTSALLVADPAGAKFLIWQGHRYPIKDEAVVLNALRAATTTATKVTLAWLDTLPLGQTLAKIDVPEAGTPAFGNLTIGQVFLVDEQMYVVWGRRSVREIEPLQAALLLSAYGKPGEKRVEMNGTELVGIDTAVLEVGLRERLPDVRRQVPGESGLCISTEDNSDFRTIMTDVEVPAAIPRPDSGSAPLADRVVVPPGHGVLVEAFASPDAAVGTLMIVTDRGVAHVIATPEALTRLGYASARRIGLPSALVARISTGPTLDDRVAGRPITSG